MHVKAVLFDLGGTLIRTAAIPEIYMRILDCFGVKVSSNEILEAHKANEKEFDIAQGQLDLGQDFWIAWNLRVLESIGIRENREFLAKKIDELWWEHADLQTYPDVKSTLVQLKANGVKLGIVTNGFKRDFKQILDRLKLTSFFDVTVGIDSCNKAKPDKEIFLYALDQLGVRSNEALFIGDSVKYDYEGAKRAGLKPFVIDREGKAPSQCDKMRSLTEVLSFVKIVDE
ncbi:MAG: HAD family hydrolase [Candidatus Bathyarchaeota archaeon]|nr:HAD family hydrolase [Candidatus Bathyarchaeota archaeon]MDH5734154.1 HAD family hydrolase [Candidatus Bathyarchaeota archaeon]